jgi:hypothetical protein
MRDDGVQPVAGRSSKTDDGVEITVGLRVFTYDMRWGTVTVLNAWPSNDDPWHRVRYDDGRVGTFNGTRLCVRPSYDLLTRFPDTQSQTLATAGETEAKVGLTDSRRPVSTECNCVPADAYLCVACGERARKDESRSQEKGLEAFVKAIPSEQAGEVVAAVVELVAALDEASRALGRVTGGNPAACRRADEALAVAARVLGVTP